MTTSLLNFLRRIIQNRYMIKSLVIRDIRARYIGSFLGLFWSVIHPLSQLLIYYFVFSLILKVKLGPEYKETHFAIWLLIGLLPWMLFSEVVIRAPGAVLEQANLIKKSVFPSEILSFSHLAAALVNHFIAMTVIYLFIGFFGVGFSLRNMLFIPYLIGIALLAMGVSWTLAALNVFFRDIGQVIGVVLNLWFYVTPIIYPKEIIPEQFRNLVELNPVVHAVEGYRMAFLGQASPNLQGLGYLIVTALCLFSMGGLIFKKLKPAFADVL